MFVPRRIIPTPVSPTRPSSSASTRAPEPEPLSPIQPTRLNFDDIDETEIDSDDTDSQATLILGSG